MGPGTRPCGGPAGAWRRIRSRLTSGAVLAAPWTTLTAGAARDADSRQAPSVQDKPGAGRQRGTRRQLVPAKAREAIGGREVIPGDTGISPFDP